MWLTSQLTVHIPFQVKQFYNTSTTVSVWDSVDSLEINMSFNHIHASFSGNDKLWNPALPSKETFICFPNIHPLYLSNSKRMTQPATSLSLSIHHLHFCFLVSLFSNIRCQQSELVNFNGSCSDYLATRFFAGCSCTSSLWTVPRHSQKQCPLLSFPEVLMQLQHLFSCQKTNCKNLAQVLIHLWCAKFSPQPLLTIL